ncbi:MAG TPA: EAL domain-containing protein [Steroidobacteraceae bacterium]|jgi:diguanylate cyclase (GGDEF)-like protein|nr:EAL domain-containing protein [Steroidobacteraceae bacterium]
MIPSAETWTSYAQLLSRLSPRISHIQFASADGDSWWSSDPSSASRVQYALTLLQNSHPARHIDVDGLVETVDSSESRFGFRIRGALGEVLGLVVIALPAPEARLELSAVHAQIKPALDCLQSELSARAAIGELNENLADNNRELDLFQRLSEATAAEGLDSLGQIPTLANEHLSGVVSAILLPYRNLTICRARSDQPQGTESEVLAQMHRHLLTRAQLHRCTLVANRLALDGSNAAVPYKAISTPICDEARRVIGVLAVFRADSDGDFQLRDAEALELLSRKATQIIRTSFDPVTGLLTTAAFNAQTAAKLAARQVRQGTHGLLYIDIDQLNLVNENHGMHVGDEVIQSIAQLLSRRARQGTLIARMGGDRFAMFLPGCGIEPAARVAEELRSAAIRLSGARDDKPLLVSLSIGVSRLCDRDLRLDHAMASAELACRTAKERGRNRVEVFYGNEQTSERQRASLGFAAQVDAALASDSLELLAQPILPLSRAPADPRFEILLRMRAADGTRLGLEKMTGADQDLSRRIDRWVIEQVIQRLAECRNLLREHPAKFSLNLSAASLADGEFWQTLEALVRKSRIEPGTLGFEFPEEAASLHIGVIAPFMCRLREQGISFSLDNFGRGIGSLSHLNSLPVSCIKIDGSFSRDLLDNPKSQSMVVAIAKLASTLGMETVAGHVETDAIRARAAQLGVDYGQGFFIGKPMALDDAIRDLPLYSCFATSTGLFDSSQVNAAALGG